MSKRSFTLEIVFFIAVVLFGFRFLSFVIKIYVKAPGNTVGGLQELCVKQGFPMPTYSDGTVDGQPHQRNFSISKLRLKLIKFSQQTPIFLSLCLCNQMS